MSDAEDRGSEREWVLTRESHEWCEQHQLGYDPERYGTCPKCKNERIDSGSEEDGQP